MAPAGGRRCLLVVFIGVSLMMSDGEPLLTCLLAICMSSLEKCLFGSFAHLFNRIFYVIV